MTPRLLKSSLIQWVFQWFRPVSYTHLDEFFHKVYGEELSRIIIQKKKQEWDEFCEQVTAWEVEKYLDRI